MASGFPAPHCGNLHVFIDEAVTRANWSMDFEDGNINIVRQVERMSVPVLMSFLFRKRNRALCVTLRGSLPSSPSHNTRTRCFVIGGILLCISIGRSNEWGQSHTPESILRRWHRAPLGKHELHAVS
jgi:hypothetical protein